jgi:4-diphosphocytidyl-2-C-methyl-D-erythritol kinase
MMNELFVLKLTDDQMQLYASQLGSDCAFFIANKASVATGRGEILSPVDVDLSLHKIVLVNPGIMINSSWAFSKILPAAPTIPVHEILKQPVHEWKKELVNDFEVPVFSEYPELKKIKTELYKQGAVYASLSGSGSTVFGVFEDENKALEVSKQMKHYGRAFTARTVGRAEAQAPWL